MVTGIDSAINVIRRSTFDTFVFTKLIVSEVPPFFLSHSSELHGDKDNGQIMNFMKSKCLKTF